MPEYLSNKKRKQSIGINSYSEYTDTTKIIGNVLVGFGSIGVGTTIPTQDVDVDTIRVRDTLYDYTNSGGVFGYYLVKDTGGIKWVAVPPIDSNAIFVAENNNILGVSSFTGLNIISDELIGVSTNPINPNFADIRIVPRWLKSGDTGIYTTKNVGIGTTIPTTDFQVGFGTTGVTIDGSIGVVSALGYYGNYAFIDQITVSDQLNVVGLGSTLVAAYLASAGGITTTGGDLYVGGSLFADKLDIINLKVVNIEATGITTLNVGIVSTFRVTGVSTLGVTSTKDLFVDANLKVSGITTLGITSTKDLFVDKNLYVVGIATATRFSTGATGSAINITSNTISGPAEIIIDPADIGDNSGAVRIKGDLFVDGEEFIVNSTTIELADFNVGIASTVGTNFLLDGAGIGIGSTNIRKTLTYDYSSDSLKSSENFDLGTGKVYKINETEVLSSTQLTVANIKATGVSTLGFATIGQLYVSGVSTFVGVGTFINDLYVGGDLYVADDIFFDELNAKNANITGITTLNVGIVSTFRVTGVSTLGVTSTKDLFVDANLKVSGITTLGITSISQLNVSGITTLGITSTTNLTSQQLNVSGITTLGITSISQLNVAGILTASRIVGTSLSISGISTIANFLMTPVGTGATVGGIGVTYYGDGSQLTKISSSSGYADTAGIATNVIGGIASVTSLNVSGITTLSSIVGTSLSITGISTLGVTSTTNLTSQQLNVSGITTLGVTSTTNLTSQQLLVTGITTLASIVGTSLSISGISTIANFLMTPVGTGATVGGIGVTYYGDGRNLTNIVSTSGYASSAGIATNIGAGVTGSVPYQSNTGITSFVPNATANDKVLIWKDGIPVWGDISAGSIVGVATYADRAGIADNVIGGIASVTSLNVTGITTLASIVGTSLSISGISTLGVTSTTNLTSKQLLVTGITTLSSIVGTSLSISGISTIANFIITNVGTGATVGGVGIVTYYGDGRNLTNIVSGYATTAGIATYATNAGIATNVIGGIGSITQLQVTGVSTFTNGPILVGSSTSTGTSLQRLQVTGGAYVSGNLGVGTTNPTSKLTVQGDVLVSGILTASRIVGTSLSITGISTIANFLMTPVGTGATVGGIGVTYYGDGSGLTNINLSSVVGVVTYADRAGISSYAPNAGVSTALQYPRTISLAGDLGGSVSFDGSADVSIDSTIQPNSVGLGTDTFGDYVKDITGTANQITVTGGTGEGSSLTLSIPNQFTAPQDVTVNRDLQVIRNLNVNGNITIGGTSAIIFSQSLNIFDPDIVLGYRTDSFGNDTSNDNTANHGGVALASTEGTPLVQLFIAGIETNPATYKKFMWFKAGTFAGLGTDAWLSNYAVGIGSTQFPTGTRLAAGSVQFTENDLAVVRNINASGIITASTFRGTLIGGIASVTSLDVSGITTLASIVGTSLSITGISTIANFRITNVGTGATVGGVGVLTYYGDGSGLTNINLSSVVGVVTYADRAGIATNVIGGIASVTSLNVTGITTLASIVGTSLSITGISTIANFRITNVGTGATVGGIGVTYYGDGLNLTGIVTSIVAGTNITISPSGTGQVTINSNSSGGGSISISTNTANQSQYITYVAGTGNTTGLGVTIGGLVFNPASGNLGIGTTNPTSKLTVQGDVLVSGVLTATRLYSGIYGEFVGGSISGSDIVGTSLSISGISTFTNGPVLIGTGTSTGTALQRLQVTGGAYVSGNLGIGTTTPTSKLTVVGDVSVSGVLTATRLYSGIYGEFVGGSVSGTNIVGTSLSITGISTLGSVKISSGIITSTTGGIVTYYGDGSKLDNIIASSSAVAIATNTTNQSQFLTYVSQTGNVTGLGVTIGGLVFNPASGNLGIGTITPTSKLDVRGDVSIASTLGIGTVIDIVPYDTLNSGTLSWEGSAGQLFSITNNLTTGSIYSVNDVSGIPSIDVYANGTIQLGPYGGNVGVGTTNPTAKLDVVGSAIISGITTIGLANTSTPPNNSQMSFELTSNTNLRFKVRGSDGVLRSGNITLA